MSKAETNTATQTRAVGSPWALADAAEYLGVSKQTLRRAIDRGKLKPIRFGVRVMLPDATVKKLAAEGMK